MSLLSDAADGLLNLTKKLALIDDRFKRQDEDSKELRLENRQLRDAIAALTARVAVLEEGRKTVDADVGRKMTEVIAAWQKQADEAEKSKLREENEELRKRTSGTPPKLE